MRENWNEIYSDEKNISLTNMLCYILKKWRSMFLISFALILLVFGVTFVKNDRDFSKSEGTDTIDSAIELSDEEKKIYETKLDLIEEYRDNIREYDHYLENSIKLKLAPLRYYNGEAKYLLSADTAANLISAVDSYKSTLTSEESFRNLSEQLEETPDIAYLWEVIYVDREDYAGDSEESVQFNDNQAVLTIVVEHYDRKECQKMLDFFENQMSSDVIEGSVSVSKIASNMRVYSDMSLITASRDVKNLKNSAYDSIASIENNMTTEEWNCYVNEKMPQDGNEAAQGEYTAGNTSSIKVAAKYAVVAGIAAFVIMVCWYGVIYLFSGRVQSKQELESYFGLPVVSLAAETEGKKKNVLDNLIDKIERWQKGSSEDSLEMIAAVLKSYAVQYATPKIYITGSKIFSLENSQVTQLKELLKKDGIELIAGNSILKDPYSLKDAADAGYIVFLEKCGKSLEKDIKEEVNKTISCGIKVLAVILEK